ncbi:unnamed protein product, partial [marine sediment metagenome]
MTDLSLLENLSAVELLLLVLYLDLRRRLIKLELSLNGDSVIRVGPGEEELERTVSDILGDLDD